MNLTKEMKLEMFFNSKDTLRAIELFNEISNIEEFISKSSDTDEALKEVYNDVQELIVVCNKLPELVKNFDNDFNKECGVGFMSSLFHLEAYILDLLEDE